MDIAQLMDGIGSQVKSQWETTLETWLDAFWENKSWALSFFEAMLVYPS